MACLMAAFSVGTAMSRKHTKTRTLDLTAFPGARPLGADPGHPIEAPGSNRRSRLSARATWSLGMPLALAGNADKVVGPGVGRGQRAALQVDQWP
ncbi:hypothetical protein P7K49_032606 [Saguinus oedipus]|uniref:Uncharacterized protein n=1 Tax=Saguinus oedipus TaxID=9490 RepID=A0ABQ9TZH7_SAGOE|nr:hypothetical protein P7K49_032606 [Saguinus oedipus]